MDMRFWWLRCRASQDQFRYYWDAGSKTGLITTPNTTRIPTIPPDYTCWHLGLDWHMTSTFRQTIGSRVFPQGFSHFYFFANFLLFHLSFFPTSWMLPQGCEELLILTMDRSYIYSQELSESGAANRQHHQ